MDVSETSRALGHIHVVLIHVASRIRQPNVAKRFIRMRIERDHPPIYRMGGFFFRANRTLERIVDARSLRALVSSREIGQYVLRGIVRTFSFYWLTTLSSKDMILCNNRIKGWLRNFR